MKEAFFEFYIRNKKIKIKAKLCKSLWSKFTGLMFKTESKPLLFIFNKEKKLSIHSFFCKPFFAVWISSSRKAEKILKINKWRSGFSGAGKYILEIPKSDVNYSKMTKICNLADGEK
jgi:uncharacterized membrane protein (UPF0127 family)